MLVGFLGSWRYRERFVWAFVSERTGLEVVWEICMVFREIEVVSGTS